jgi:hypothetical protein
MSIPICEELYCYPGLVACENSMRSGSWHLDFMVTDELCDPGVSVLHLKFLCPNGPSH